MTTDQSNSFTLHLEDNILITGEGELFFHNLLASSKFLI